ncbi:MAG: UDP-3-O-(3-hydroxymyristoyl)glucosamine N-acyltransferase [Gammaproteobacteria bacterium]
MSHTLGDIAKTIGAELEGDPGCEIRGVGTLENAQAGQISFFSNRRYTAFLKATRATAVILKREDGDLCPVARLVHENPYLGYAQTARLLYPEPETSPGTHPLADIDPTAIIHLAAYIGPHVSVGGNTLIGEHAYIGSGCVIGSNVVIGAGTRLTANVVVCQGVKIGARGLFHPGVVIGADGFGIANDGGKWLKIPQTGSVEIGDDVEIGANTTIDRGAIENTVIEDGVKIDNQVQVGHNVHIGAHTAIAGCVAIAGSVRIGKRCMIGGASGISGHIEIADDVVLMGMTGVPNSIMEPGIYASAIPAMEVATWRKNAVSFKHLYEMNVRLRKIENKK